MTGDFFREAAVAVADLAAEVPGAAALAAPRFAAVPVVPADLPLAAARDFAALFLLAVSDLTLAGALVLVAARRLADLAAGVFFTGFAARLPAAAVPDFFDAAFLAGAFFAAVFLTADFLVARCVVVAFFPADLVVAFLALPAAVFLGADLAEADIFFAAGFFAADARAVPRDADLAAALARDLGLLVDFAAMICLSFLTDVMSRPRTSDAGDFEGRVSYQNPVTLTI